MSSMSISAYNENFMKAVTISVLLSTYFKSIQNKSLLNAYLLKNQSIAN